MFVRHFKLAYILLPPFAVWSFVLSLSVAVALDH